MRYVIVAAALLAYACSQPVQVVAPDDDGKSASQPKNRKVYEQKQH